MAASDALRRYLANLDARRGSLRDEVEDDVAPLRGRSLEERARILESVCRDAWAILRARSDFERAVDFRQARSQEAEETWARLAASYKEAHGRR